MTPPVPPTPAPELTWEPPHLIPNFWWRWATVLGLVAYLAYASTALDLNWARFVHGLPRAWDFISRMVPPSFERWELIVSGGLESLRMALISSFIGVVIGVPVAVGASRNLSPWYVYLLSRGYIAISRTFPEVIIAILFVKAFGFGAFAGTLTLVAAASGFIGKLLAEDIEDIDPGQVEAIRATGAGGMKVLLYGVFPQVLPRLVGLAIYRLDINLRASTIIGIVGAGGIGSALFHSFKRYDYDFTLAILLVIIAMVMVAELVSTELRRRIQ